MIQLRASVALALLSACSSLDPIEPGVCGNGVVEDGEDCDSSDPSCDACGLLCDATGGCAIAGYTCGADQFCHAPAGAFRPATLAPRASASYRVTDVDHDGIGDVVSQSQTSIDVLFGSFDADLAATESILTPIARGPAQYADIDADGALDVLLPTADGLVAYTSPFGVPAPFPFPSSIGRMGFPLFAHIVDFGYIAFIGRDAQGTFGYQVLNIQPDPPIEFGPVSLCGAVESDYDPQDVSTLLVTPGHTLLSVTLAATSATPKLCIMAADRQADGSVVIKQVTPALLHPPAGRAVLAPIRGPGCPSLVMRERVTGNLVEYHPAGSPGSCSFVAGPTTLSTSPQGGDAVGFMPLVPQAAGMATAVVLQGGIFGFDGSGLQPLYASDRPLAAAQFADYDGNGTLDLIASGLAADDLDIIFRNGPAFVRFRLDTDAPVKQVLLGDFDGNGRLDIAYVQKLLAADELSVSYNTGDQPLPGVLAGRFKQVLSVISAEIPDSNDPGSVVSDLAILADSATGPQVSLLHGSPQRTMLSFFDPRPTPGPGPLDRTSVFRGVVAGNFVDSPGGVDLISGDDVDTETPVPASHTEFWLSDGAMGGAVEGLEPVYAPQVVRCDGGATADALCIGDASYTAWPTAPDHDLVLGVDVRGHAAAADPRAVVRDPATNQLRVPLTLWPDLIQVPAASFVRSVRVLDIHGDQTAVVAFQDANGRGTGVVRCAVDRATGVGSACTRFEDAVNAAEPTADWTCVDGATARVAPASRFSPPVTTEPDLLVLCKSALRDAVFRFTDDGAHALFGVDHGDQLQVGDLSGDGVDDIVVLDRTVVPLLRVFVQCNSRDGAACTGGL